MFGFFIATISLVQASPATRNAQHKQIRANQNPNLAISFGSCYGIWDLESSIFQTIEATTDLFVWLGDVAYVDEMTSLFAIPFEFRTMPVEFMLERL
jgi:hypothetical protein